LRNPQDSENTRPEARGRMAPGLPIRSVPIVRFHVRSALAISTAANLARSYIADNPLPPCASRLPACAPSSLASVVSVGSPSRAPRPETSPASLVRRAAGEHLIAALLAQFVAALARTAEWRRCHHDRCCAQFTIPSEINPRTVGSHRPGNHRRHRLGLGRAFVGAVTLPLLIGAVAAATLTIVFVIEAAKNEQIAAIRELTASMRGTPATGSKGK